MTLQTTFSDYMNEVVDGESRIVNTVRGLKGIKMSWHRGSELVPKQIKESRITLTEKDYNKIIKDLRKKKIDAYVFDSKYYIVCRFGDDCFIAVTPHY